jgi:UDP-N-acetylglucosamine diphosphorylase/glucosamine-1-phosphate N-acetyltransferase
MLLKSITISENDIELDKFYPFNILHPIYEVRFGCFRFFERVISQFPDLPLSYEGRTKHKQSFIERFGIEDNLPELPNLKLFSNHLLTNEFTQIIAEINNNTDIYSNGLKIASLRFDLSENIEKIEVNVETFNALWDLIYINEKAINEDFKFFNFEQKDFENVSLINRKNISIAQSAKISPFCVLDASNGAIVIEDNVKIMPHSTIIGPCHIGKETVIKIGAKIYEKTSIGNNCKIGGEIENSIIQSYSNKQHDGFLGHSFISEWVNLGADTNNSDLKNTYENISLRINGVLYETNKMFLGLLCGDHTKSSINTQFNTGTTIGISAIIVYSGFPPTFIPSFSFGGKADSPIYRLSSTIKTAENVLGRRGKRLTNSEIELLEEEYKRVSKKD